MPELSQNTVPGSAHHPVNLAPKCAFVSQNFAAEATYPLENSAPKSDYPRSYPGVGKEARPDVYSDDKRGNYSNLLHGAGGSLVFEADQRKPVGTSRINLETQLRTEVSAETMDYPSVNQLELKRLSIGVNWYKCPICEKPFEGGSNLKNHYMTHTGEKPFACSICSYKARRKYDLKYHYYTVHKGNYAP